MIDALKTIGECVVRKEFQISEITNKFWIEDVYKSIYLISEEAFNYDYYENQVKNSLEGPHIIYIKIIDNNTLDSFRFEEIKLSEAIPSNNDMWIKKEAIGGKYFSPTVPLEISTKREAMIKNVKNSIENIIKTLQIEKNEKSQKIYPEDLKVKLVNIRELLKNEIELIASQISDEIFLYFIENDVPKNKINIIISLQINNETLKQNNLLSKFLFHKFIEKNLKINNAFKNGEIIWNNEKEERICSVCSQSHKNITSEYKPYTFYSKDKLSYNTQSQLTTNGNMFPIDIKCAYLVEIGRCYVDKNFEFRLGIEKFKIIPKILFPIDPEDQMSLLNIKSTYKDLIKNESRDNRILQEDFLLSVLKDFNNAINYDMIFFKKNQAEFKILLHIKDIAPSRIKKIHNAFKSSRKMGNSEGRNFGNLLSFYSIERFFSRYEGDSIKYDKEAFYEMINIIFSGKAIEKVSLLKTFFSNLTNKMFKSKERPSKSLNTETHAALLIFEFLKQLNQLKW